jgi:macrolide-specific efflux system membrane fusion protein
MKNGTRLPVPVTGQISRFSRGIASRAPRGLVRSARRYPWRWAAVLAVFIIAAIVATCGSKKSGDKPVYREFQVSRGDITVAVSTPGEVSPQNRIELKPPLAGRIEQILVREGDWVKKSQVLAYISPPERAALLDAARLKSGEEAARWEDAYKAAPLVAPLTGFIILRRAEPGQTIGAGDAPLVMADRLIVRAQVDETDMGRIKVGQKAEVSLDAYPGVKIPARVDHLAYEAKQVNNVTVYDIEVELLKDPSILRSGMTATASIIVTHRRNVLIVPAEALADFEGGVGVMVKRKGKAPSMVPVTVGVNDGADMEVVKGLEEGETILINTKGVASAAATTTGNPFMPGGQRKAGAQRAGGGGGGHPH